MATTQESTGRTIEKEIFIRATPERVFRALTEKADLEAWFVKEATVDLRVGGALRLFWDPESVEGVFLEVDPPRRVVFTWDERPQVEGITTSAFTLTAEGDGTRLHLIHSGFGSGTAWDRLFEGVNSGWESELENLRVYIEAGTRKARR
ncbi:MAG: SRPBCC family protein [Thermomicrobiales bacterium]